jgi:hypothetical protein
MVDEAHGGMKLSERILNPLNGVLIDLAFYSSVRHHGERRRNLFHSLDVAALGLSNYIRKYHFDLLDGLDAAALGF